MNADEEANSSVVVDDRRPLIINAFSRTKKHKRCLCCLSVTSAVLTLNVIAMITVYFIKIRSLSIMELNVWGMPQAFGGLDKTERMTKIADIIQSTNYDVICLEELWMSSDYNLIYSKIPPGYNITKFRELSTSLCDGRIAPTGCSGLTVITKYVPIETEFHPYTDHGKASEMFIDGEYLARKGVGRVRIAPDPSVIIDLFITHTIADAPPGHDYNNNDDRRNQVRELLNSYILKSDADLVILSGDFNAPPDNSEETPYSMIKKYMHNCVEEIYYKIQQLIAPKLLATYANPENSWSFNKTDPVIYDYIFYKVNMEGLVAWTNFFKLPFLHFYKDHQKISVSDHEAITATIYYKKWSKYFPYV